jgi:hypothetical protein
MSQFGPEGIDPENPIEPLSPQAQQATGKKARTVAEVAALIRPAAPPTATIGSRPEDTRSVRQRLVDEQMEAAAKEEWRKNQGDMRYGYWTKRGGEWIKQQRPMAGAFGVQDFDERSTQELVGQAAVDVGRLIKSPFKFLVETVDDPIIAVGKQLDRIPGTEWVEDAIGWTGNMAYDSFKGLVRNSMLAMATPIQMVENLIMFGTTFYSTGGWEGSKASNWEQIRGIFTNTSLFQTIKEGDAGEGFFTTEAVERQRNELEEYLRPKVYGQTATVGRTIAGLLVASNVVEAGDDLHSLFSGGIDAAFQIFIDPANYLRIPQQLQRLDRVPTAALTPREYKKLVRSGTILDDAVLAKIDEAANAIDESEVLTQEAIDLMSPKAGIVYSGDRHTPNLVRDQFLDIDDPNYVANPNNLLNEGLYVSDAPALAGSYTTNAGPEDVFGTGQMVPSVNPQDEFARVYKFEFGDDINIVDTEQPWPTTGTPWSVDQFLTDNNVRFDVYEQLVDEMIDSGIAVKKLSPEEFDRVVNYSVFGDETDITLYDFMTQNGQGEASQRAWKTLFGGNINIRQTLVNMSQKDNFADLFNAGALRNSNAKQNIAAVSGSYLSYVKNAASRMVLIFEQQGDVGGKYTLLKKLVDRAEKLEKFNPTLVSRELTNDELAKYLGELNAINADQMFLDVTDPTVFAASPRDVYSFMFSIISESGNNSVFSKKLVLANGKDFDFQVLMNGELRNYPVWSENGSTSFNRWLASKGVDGARYAGGRLMGGYGEHNAYAIFRPSKLTLTEAQTGEKIGAVAAKKMIEEGKDLSVRAEDIAQAQGFKSLANALEEYGKTMNANPYMAWKQTGFAKNLFTALSNQRDAFDIWVNVLRRRSPRLAQKLADALTPQQVEKVFDEAAMSIDPFERLQALPGWSGNVVSELGYRTKQLVSTKSRLAATLPRTGSMPFDDFVAGAQHVDDAAVLVNLPIQARRELMNKYISIVTQDDPQKIRGDLFDFANEAKRVIVEERLKPVIDRLSAPMNKKFEEMNVVERLTMKARAEIVEELREFARRNRRWTGDSDEFTRYTIDDIGRGVELDYMIGNGRGPAYVSQQNMTNAQILPFDDKELDRLIDLTARWAVLRETTKVVPGVKRVSDALSSAKDATFWLQTLWKKSVLLTGRYIARVVPEEVATVQFSGVFGPYEFSYLSEVVSGRLNKDIYGRMSPYFGEADELQELFDQVDTLNAMAGRALARGDEAAAAKLQQRIDSIDLDVAQTRLNEIENILEREGATVRDVMIGPDVGKAAETALGQKISSRIKAKSQQTVTKAEDPELWKRFIAQSVIERSVNVVGSGVAKALLSGRPGALQNIVDQMMTDGTALRREFIKYFKQQAKLDPTYNWDSVDGAMNYVRIISNDLTQVSGGHPTILSAIANGQIRVGDEIIDLGRRTAEGNIPNENFVSFMDQVDPRYPDYPSFSAYDNSPEFAVGYPRPTSETEKQMKGLFSWFMQHAYGSASDKFARVPFFNRRKWGLIADMVPLLSKDEAAKLASNIETYGLPKYIVESVLDNIPRAVGKGTLDDIDLLAGRQAVEETIELLFDSRRRTLFGRNHRLLFPFFDAFREVSTKLFKTSLNPVALHKVDKAAKAAQNARIGGPGETNILGPGDVDGDGREEGFVYKDPISKQLVWNFPLVGAAARLMTGVDFNYKVSVKSMSLVTSVLPSVGPTVSMTYSAVPRGQSEFWDRMNRFIIPFGEPTEEVQQYFTPLFLQRMVQGVTVGTSAESFTNRIFGDPNNSPVFKMMVNRTFLIESASGKYPENEEGIQQAMAAAQDKAGILYFLRGLTQFFSPAAPISEFYAKTDKGLLPLGILLEGIRNTQNTVREQGGNYQQQLDAIIGQYGDYVLPLMASVTDTNVPGAEASKAFYDFQNQNQELFKKYPAIAGYFSPKTNEFDQQIYDIQRRAGRTTVRDVEDVAADLQQLWGDLRYRQQEDLLKGQYGEAPIVSFVLSQLEEQLRVAFPKWNRELSYEQYRSEIEASMNKVIEASKDPLIQTSPVNEPLQKYLQSREQAKQQITAESKLTNVDSWKTNNGGILVREALKVLGEQLSQQNPSFEPLWKNVLSREFKTTSPQEKQLLQAGQLR